MKKKKQANTQVKKKRMKKSDAITLYVVVVLLILGAVLLTAPQYSQSMSLFSMLAWWFVRLVLTNRTEDVLIRNSRILP